MNLWSRRVSSTEETDIIWIGSPNRAKGRCGFCPEAVVIHIMEETLAWTDVRFKDRSSKVSAHYGIASCGEIHQWVSEMDTAWHAGRRYKPTWKLIRPENPNLYTLGIEHEGYEDSLWSDEMVEASLYLIGGLCNRWHIPPDRDHIIGHREIYARKTCPGSWLDLDWFVAEVKRTILSKSLYNHIPSQGSVRARVDLNIRKGAPSSAAPVVRTITKGTELSYTGWTSNGLNVHGNPHWYRDEEGDFFWAGATDEPVPRL